MTTPVAYASATQFVGLSFETTPGTPAASPTYFYPFKPGSAKWTPNASMLNDDGVRTSMVDVYNQVQGIRHDSFEFVTYLYVDSFPLIMRGLLGSTDTKTGTATPYTHKLSLLNNAVSSGNQPPTLTVWYFDGGDCQQLTWGLVDEVSIKLTATGLAEATVKIQGFPTTSISVPTYSSTTTVAPPSWNSTYTVFAGTQTNIIEMDLTYKRGVKPIEAMTGSTSPLQMWAGPLSCQGGKLTATYQGSTAFAYGLNNTQGAMTIQLNPAGDTVDYHKFQHTNVAFKNPVINSSKEWVEFDIETLPLPNSTDALAGGVSPLMYQVVNGVSTSY